MKILSAFTRPLVVANSLKDNWKFGTIDFSSIVSMEVNGAKVPIVLQNIAEERNSYWFEQGE